MSSYQYPQHILHRVIEPQWFPDRKEETESTLTAVEMAEEAHALYLQKIVTEFSPTAGAVIIGQRVHSHGRSGTPTGRRNRPARRSSSEATATTTTTTTAAAPSSSAAVASAAEDVMAGILSPPPMSASQRFWNRTVTGTTTTTTAASRRRSSSGTHRTEVRQS